MHRDVRDLVEAVDQQSQQRPLVLLDRRRGKCVERSARGGKGRATPNVVVLGRPRLATRRAAVPASSQSRGPISAPVLTGAYSLCPDSAT